MEGKKSLCPEDEVEKEEGDVNLPIGWQNCKTCDEAKHRFPLGRAERGSQRSHCKRCSCKRLIVFFRPYL